MKRKGLNPFPVTQPKIQGVNSAILQQYGADSYISEGYLSNSDVYAIVSFLARKAGSIPWYVYKMKPGAKAQTALQQYKQLTKGLQHKGAYEQALIKRKSAYEENMVTNSPLAKLLEQPNPQQAQDQFFENLYGYRILSGEGNIYGNDGGIEGAKFVELNVLPTQFLDIYPDPKDLYGLLGYKLMVGAGIDLPKEQVCQWKSWNPDFNADTRSHMRGLSPLRPGWKLLRMSNNAADASAAMTSNGGAKGAIVPRPVNNSVPSLTPEQASLVQRMVNDRVNNKDQKGAIGVFQTPWDYLNFGLSSVDMELVKTMQMTLHQWCRLFGLPVVLFDTDSSSYNNYSNAMRDLITNTIMPLNCQLRDELNKWLVPRFGEDVYIDFDISALPEMQQDMERMVNQLRMADWLTFDEKRVAMNYEERGGAYAFSYVNQGLLPLEQVNMDLTVSNDQSGNMGNGDSQIS
jgi:HK97 family phage portal protein